ncbi:MAG TPA: response regulator transcription factor [Thermoanaerobaculia bacterium]|nr:response regulator transcription factor [Thermoanaerobaculia bacterium]
MNSIRVVIADDHPMFRRGLLDAIGHTGGISVVGEAATGEEAWKLIQSLKPDVAVLDIEMPGERGLSILKKARENGLQVRILFLTMHRDEAIFNAAIDAGAAGYLLKDAAASEITTGIRAAASGTPYISAGLSSLLLGRAERAAALREQKPELQRLTSAERKILKSISLGRTSKEIAHELGVSYRTVENHRANICSKLSLSGTNVLLRFALEHKGEL